MKDPIAILATLPTATIYEAAGQQGALDPMIMQMVAGVGIAGLALPIRCMPFDSLPVLRAIGEVAAGDVLVIDAGVDGATVWGGTSTIAARQRGVAGVVTNGAVRDIDELRADGFAAFARYASVHGTRKEQAGAIGLPIALGGQMIARGDFVRGDGDGVVIVPAARISEVAAAALLKRADEERRDTLLRKGSTLAQVLDLE